MKKILSMILVTVLCVSFLQPITAHAAIKINKEELTLIVGDTYKLKVTGTAKIAKWKSLTKEVATVSQSGVVKAKATGVAIIIAEVNSQTLFCTVLVYPTDKNILLYEDDFVLLTYINLNDYGSSIGFKIYNKTNHTISIKINDIVADGKSYPQKFKHKIPKIASNTTGIYWYGCDIDKTSIKKLSGSFRIFDATGKEISHFKIKNINLQ